MKNIVFLFAGQGSQFFFMAEKLYETDLQFANWMNYFDQIYKDKVGTSILSYIYDKNRSIVAPMDDITYSNPAIFMTEVSLAKTIMAHGIEPTAVIGASLGEFAASAIAGILDIKETFETLIDISYDVKNICPKGAMLAILSNNEIYYKNDWMRDDSTIVANNYDQHFVISGEYEKIKSIKKNLGEMHVANVLLPVLYAFHTKGIDALKHSCLQRMSEVGYRESNIDYISGEKGHKITYVDEDYYWDVLRNEMHFQEAIKTVDISNSIIIDVSPSGTLANFTKMIYGAKNQIYSIISLYRKDDTMLKELYDSFSEGEGW